MDSKMGQILDLIISSLKCRAQITRIGDVIWDHMHSHNVECTDEYNDFTIEEFLVLYKIKYLSNLDIIDKETAESLEKLFMLKLKLENKLGELTRHELYEDGTVDDEVVNKVLSQIFKIEDLLKKYDLVFEDDDYLRMFLISAETNDYQDIPGNEEIKKLIKEIK